MDARQRSPPDGRATPPPPPCGKPPAMSRHSRGHRIDDRGREDLHVALVARSRLVFSTSAVGCTTRRSCATAPRPAPTDPTAPGRSRSRLQVTVTTEPPDPKSAALTAPPLPHLVRRWSTDCRSRCSIGARWPWTGAALDGTRRPGDSLLTCGNDTRWPKPNPDDMTGFGLLIRGFGVRVPGGALTEYRL
jgi:hypothetical protein